MLMQDFTGSNCRQILADSGCKSQGRTSLLQQFWALCKLKLIAWSTFVFHLGPTYTLIYRHEKMQSFISELPHCCPFLALCVIGFRSSSQGFPSRMSRWFVFTHHIESLRPGLDTHTYNSIRALTSLKTMSVLFFVHYYIMSCHNTSATNYSNLEPV